MSAHLRIAWGLDWFRPPAASHLEVLNAYPNTFSLVKGLQSDLANHAKPDSKGQECSTGLKSFVRTGPRPLRKRLAPKDRQRLVADYLAGALQKDLATRYAIGLSSVKTILRDAGIRKYAIASRRPSAAIGLTASPVTCPT